jgi:hypothetical protein
MTDLISADAVPKKRGPKTDVLEALLKRVDGLEKRLKDEKKSNSSINESSSSPLEDKSTGETSRQPQLDTTSSHGVGEPGSHSPEPTRHVVK